MKRRNFLKTAGAAAATTAVATSAQAKHDKIYKWKMITTWPRNFPGLGTGAEFLAKKITEMTDGQIEVQVFFGGELVPVFETFDAVSRGIAEMGHGTAYYWKDKLDAVQFFGSVPFGLTADEMNSWLYHGGGLELWAEIYNRFNLIPAAAGNSGVQMGGWFNKEINGIDDLKDLKIRMPGLGGEVLSRLGSKPINTPGNEILSSLKSGKIDAAEWVSPYNDLAFGLHKVAKYYYYPGWHEPGTTMETFINKDAFNKLPKHLQGLVLDAARIANQDMFADFNAKNGEALDTLVNKHGVKLKKFPDEVLKGIRTVSDEVVAEIANKSVLSKRIFKSYLAYREKSIKYTDVAERAYLNARAL